MKSTLGRGPVAVADMKARIAALTDAGEDVIDALWRRHLVAVLGDGYTYEYADQHAPPDN